LNQALRGFKEKYNSINTGGFWKLEFDDCDIPFPTEDLKRICIECEGNYRHRRPNLTFTEEDLKSHLRENGIPEAILDLMKSYVENERSKYYYFDPPYPILSAPSSRRQSQSGGGAAVPTSTSSNRRQSSGGGGGGGAVAPTSTSSSHDNGGEYYKWHRNRRRDGSRVPLIDSSSSSSQSGGGAAVPTSTSSSRRQSSGGGGVAVAQTSTSSSSSQTSTPAYPTRRQTGGGGAAMVTSPSSSSSQQSGASPSITAPSSRRLSGAGGQGRDSSYVFVFDFDLTLTDEHSDGIARVDGNYITDPHKRQLLTSLRELAKFGPLYIITRGVRQNVIDYLAEAFKDVVGGFPIHPSNIYGAENVAQVRNGTSIWSQKKVDFLEKIRHKNKGIDPTRVVFMDDEEANIRAASDKKYTTYLIRRRGARQRFKVDHTLFIIQEILKKLKSGQPLPTVEQVQRQQRRQQQTKGGAAAGGGGGGGGASGYR
jgi:hypothetical protein